MRLQEIEAGCRAPMAKKPRLDVLECQRFLEQRIGVQIDLADRQVIGCAPVGIDCVQRIRQQSRVGALRATTWGVGLHGFVSVAMRGDRCANSRANANMGPLRQHCGPTEFCNNDYPNRDLPGTGKKMAKLWRFVAGTALVLALCEATAAPNAVIVMPLTGAIGPASADYVVRGLAHANDEGAQLVVLEIDTPGGLDTSMREIIKAILASPVPVAAYVRPSGARAASAGTYIRYASHIAAMAPRTNLGAATPVAIALPGSSPSSPGKEPGADKGDKDNKDKKPSSADNGDPMAKKAVHDASADIRRLTQLRNRNAEWAERAVREALSLSADEALAQHVVDVVARDVPDLLAKLDGRKITTAAGEKTLATAGVATVTIEPDCKSPRLAVIANPSVALILMMIGIYGLFFEFYNPGACCRV